MATIIFVLSFIGLLISLYFIAVDWGIELPGLYPLAAKCGLNETTCQEVIAMKEARLFFDIPNYTLGFPYYLTLMLLSLVSFPFQGFLIVLQWGIVGVSLYLAYHLYFVYRKPCTFCYTTHIINIMIAIMLTFFVA